MRHASAAFGTVEFRRDDEKIQKLTYLRQTGMFVRTQHFFSPVTEVFFFHTRPCERRGYIFSTHAAWRHRPGDRAPMSRHPTDTRQPTRESTALRSELSQAATPPRDRVPGHGGSIACALPSGELSCPTPNQRTGRSAHNHGM